jgi:hypothetical protein
MSHEHHVFRNPPPAAPGEVRLALDRGELIGAMDRQVRLLAATCLGHLARVYGRLDEDRVVPELRRVGSNDALADIEVYLHPRRGRWRRRVWKAVRPWTWI